MFLNVSPFPSSVFQLCMFQYSAHELLAPHLQRQWQNVIVCSLDLLEAYHSVSVSSSTVQPVSGVTI